VLLKLAGTRTEEDDSISHGRESTMSGP
jgi:hypothetical protein